MFYVLIISAFAAWFFFSAFVYEKLVGYAKSHIENLAGNWLAQYEMHVSYESAAPGLLGKLTLNKILAESSGSTLAVDRLRLGYDLKALFRGKLDVNSVRLEGVKGYGSIDSIKTISMRFAAAFDKPGKNGREAGSLVVELRKLDFKLVLDREKSLILTAKTADLIVDNTNGIKLGSSGSIVAQDSSGTPGLSFIKLPFVINASVSAGDNRQYFLLADIQADSNMGQVLPSRLFLFSDGNSIQAELEPKKGVKKLYASYTPSNEIAKVELELDSFVPSNLFRLAPKFQSYNKWLATNYTGKVLFEGRDGFKILWLEAALSGHLPIELPGGRPFVYVNGQGNLDNFRINKAGLSNKVMQFEYSGNIQARNLGADGKLNAIYKAEAGMEFGGSFDLIGSKSSWFAYTPELDISGSKLADAFMSLDLSKDSGLLYFETSLPQTGNVQQLEFSRQISSVVAQNPAEVYSEAVSERLVMEAILSIEDSRPVFMESTVRMEKLHIEAFPGLIGGILGKNAFDMLKPLTVQGELSFYSDFKSLSYNSSALLLIYDGIIKGFGVSSFSGGLEGLIINSFDASISGLDVNGSAYIEYKTGDSAVFNTDFSIKDIPYSLHGIWSGSFLSINGNYGLKLSASMAAEPIFLTLEIEDMPITLSGALPMELSRNLQKDRLFLSAKLAGSFVSLNSWDILLDKLALEQPQGSNNRFPSFELKGSLNNSGGILSKVAVWDKISRLEGSGNFKWALDKNPYAKADFLLSSPLGEYYSVSGIYNSDRSMEGSAKLVKFPLERLPFPWLRGSLDADISMKGMIDDPALDFTFSLNEGHRAKGFPFVHGKGTYKDHILDLLDTRARMEEISLSKLNARLDINRAIMDLSTDIITRLGENELKTSLDAHGQYSGVSLLEDLKINGRLSGIVWGKENISMIPFDIKVLEENLFLNLGSNKELLLDYKKSGELSFNLSKKLPISLSAKGIIAESAISLDLKDAEVDLAFLFKLIGLPIVKVVSGKGYGEASIKGRLADPDITGSFELENFYMSVPDFVKEPIGPLDDPLYFTGRTMETYQSGAKCGDARVNVNLRSELIRALPLDLHLGIKSEDPGLVPVKMQLLGLDIEGLVKPDLNIEVSDNASRISGSIFLNSGDVVLTTGIASSKATGDDVSNFSGDLGISFGKNVKAYFPNKKTFPVVLYGQADPSSKLYVAFDTGKGDYSVKGTAMLRGGSVFYIQKNFYLKNAVIEFDEDSYQFDPKISAEAELRTRTPSGPVIIVLTAQESRFSNLNFRLESTPALTENQIQQLLGQGLTGGSDDGKVDVSKMIIENYELIPELNLLPVLERNLKAALGFDLLVLRSQIMPKLILGLSGMDSSLNSGGLANYLAGTELVGGKYLGEKVFMQTRLGLEADPLAKTLGLRLDSEFSLEWKAPGFTLLWSIRPQNPDSLFLEDQSFSFLWRIPLK